MLLKLFQAELSGMEEMKKEDQLLDSRKNSATIYTQYIQDLYRFFKLYRFKNEFYDPFQDDLDFSDTLILEKSTGDFALLEKIGEFYFQNNIYQKAIRIFKRLPDIDTNPEILEKLAFSYQMLKDYPTALEYYLKAEIFHSKKEWVIKKIALCYRNTNQPELALKYYLRAETMDPENLYTQASIGHCYLELKEWEKALKYYFKVEYLNPKNTRVHRPIAWCSFVLGKFDTAEKYLKMIAKPNGHDYMNYGHLQWCRGNKVEAVEMYKKSLAVKDFDLDLFLDSFAEDKEFLLGHGINSDDIPILIDHLQYQMAKK